MSNTYFIILYNEFVALYNIFKNLFIKYTHMHTSYFWKTHCLVPVFLAPKLSTATKIKINNEKQIETVKKKKKIIEKTERQHTNTANFLFTN